MLRIPFAMRNVFVFNTRANKKQTPQGCLFFIGAPAGILRRLRGLARRDAPQCYESLSLCETCPCSTQEPIKKQTPQGCLFFIGAPAGILRRLRGLARRDAPQCYESLSPCETCPCSTQEPTKNRHRKGACFLLVLLRELESRTL